MTLTLYTYPGNFRAFKILVAAQYNGISLNVPDFKLGDDNKKEEFLQKSPTARVPVLETPQGTIFESNAIARYIARIRRDTELYGATFFESGQVDSWIDFSAHELEVPAMMWYYPVLGYMPFNAAATAKAKEDLKRALAVLERHLLHRTYLVGNKVTLADITVASALVYPFKLVLDKDFRKPFSNVVRWFTTIVNQKEFQAVVGEVPLVDKAHLAAGDAPAKKEAPKKEAKKETKKEAPKKEAAEEEPPKPKKKEEHPLAVLNQTKPSPMPMDKWKVCYSNVKPLSKAMEEFWEMLDREGYSIWFQRYNYNDECKVLFMTSNAVSGFIQRTDPLRKFAFGVMDVIGAGPYEIVGCWLFRGDEVKHMLDANPDAEYYTWTKVTKEELNDPAVRKRIEEYWCNEDTLEGKPIADSKVFK